MSWILGRVFKWGDEYVWVGFYVVYWFFKEVMNKY